MFMIYLFVYFKIKDVERINEKVNLLFQVTENDKVIPAKNTTNTFNVFSIDTLEKRLQYTVKKCCSVKNTQVSKCLFASSDFGGLILLKTILLPI